MTQNRFAIKICGIIFLNNNVTWHRSSIRFRKLNIYIYSLTYGNSCKIVLLK